MLLSNFPKNHCIHMQIIRPFFNSPPSRTVHLRSHATESVPLASPGAPNDRSSSLGWLVGCFEGLPALDVCPHPAVTLPGAPSIRLPGSPQTGLRPWGGVLANGWDISNSNNPHPGLVSFPAQALSARKPLTVTQPTPFSLPPPPPVFSITHRFTRNSAHQNQTPSPTPSPHPNLCPRTTP